MNQKEDEDTLQQKREAILERNKKYRDNNKVMLSNKFKEYYLKHRDIINSKRREAYQLKKLNSSDNI